MIQKSFFPVNVFMDKYLLVFAKTMGGFKGWD